MLSKSSLFQGLLLVHRPRTHPCPIPGVSSRLQVLCSAKDGLSSDTVTMQRTD